MDIRPLLSTVTQIIKLNYIREAGSGKITLTYKGSYYDVRGMWYYTAMIITGRLLTCKIKFFVCKIARIVLATTFHPTLGRWLTCWWCRCSFFNTWTTYRAVVQLPGPRLGSPLENCMAGCRFVLLWSWTIKMLRRNLFHRKRLVTVSEKGLKNINW